MKERFALVFSAFFILSALTPLLVIVNQSGEAGAAAPSPVKWSKYASNPVMSPGGSGSWEGVIIFPASIIDEGGGQLLLYYQGSDGSTTRIGLATSGDGISWTKSAGNPLLPGGSPAVIKDGGTSKMWYLGTGGVCLATSADGRNFTNFSGNPVMKPGAASTW